MKFLPPLERSRASFRKARNGCVRGSRGRTSEIEQRDLHQGMPFAHERHLLEQAFEPLEPGRFPADA
jgi:hypothetical protein